MRTLRKPRARAALATGLASLLLLLASAAPSVHAKDDIPARERFWPAWRGPLGTGVAPHADPPIEWSESKNIRWHVDVPGLGHSTPIVWDDFVVVTTAVPFGDAIGPIFDDAPGSHDNLPVTHRHRFVVLAYRRSDGKLLWERVVKEAIPPEQGHVTASLASASPVTDGERIYVSFGTQGVYCLERDGEVVWKADLGRFRSKHAHGEGPSPVLHDDLLIVNWDHEGDSFIVALDKETGKERWKSPRNEPTSWATPIVYEHEGKAQLIVSGTSRVRGYDARSGAVLWECGGLSHNVVASPVAGAGMVFAASSYEIRNLLAIRLDGAKGDITGTKNVAWTRQRGTPYVPSLLLYDGSLYFLRHYQGILTRVDARTGREPHPPIRLPQHFEIYSSPVAAKGRVYVTSREGITAVIEHGASPRILAENRLPDVFSASAAVVDRELYLRGERSLWSIGEGASKR